MQMKPKALLLSGYHAHSQAQWTDYVIAQCDHYEWSLNALPPRYFAWRMRGAPLSFIALNEQSMKENYDLLVATSSVDLCTVQSLNRTLADTYSLLYFHENQFAYPKSHQPQSVVDWQMVSIYSAIRADGLLFNSQFNQDTFLTGVDQLLKKLPDLVPSGVVTELEKKSRLLPVAIEDAIPVKRAKSGTTHLLWNHRWEWDKQPELLLAFIKELKRRNADFKLTISGQEFRRRPASITELLTDHADVIHQAGFIESRKDYLEILRQADVVVSTASHEFQGLAVMEAVAHGCTPLLPNALSYPEFFAPEYLYETQPDVQKTAENMAEKFLRWKKTTKPKAPDLRALMHSNLDRRYRETIVAGSR